MAGRLRWQAGCRRESRARRKNPGTGNAWGEMRGVWQNERNAKRARPVVTWKGPQWLSAGRTHLIHDLISHPVTNQHAEATTRDVRFKHFYPRANNKAVNVIDTDKGEATRRFHIFSHSSPTFAPSFLLQRGRSGKKGTSRSRFVYFS